MRIISKRGGTTLIVAMIGAAGCSQQEHRATPPVPVELASTATIAAPLTIEANGVVEPLQTVAVQAQVGGTLQEVDFNEGDDVQAGQVLFRLDPRPFESALRQAQAQLARDSATAANAQRDAQRYLALAAKDYVTKSQADQQESAAASTQATVEASRAAVENAKLNLSYTTIRSPIAGRTGRLLVRQGNLVHANAEDLVVINTLHPILIRFPVVQRDFPALQRRNMRGPVPVRVAAADSSRVAETGTLAFLDNAVDSLTGTVTAKARFENQSNVLWPGEYVRVSVELEVQPSAVAVPTRAVMAGQDGSYVYVVGADHVAKVRPITPGRVVGQLTTIAKGLTPGEQVVVDGQSRLTPNAHVAIKPPANAQADAQSTAQPTAQTMAQGTTQAGTAR